MISTVYVERGVKDHERTARVLERLPKATVVECERYGEVFNRRQQSFRLQKRNPSLILSEKTGELVLPTPAGYGVGGAHNSYFSHMLNCPYDCRYCFLQGMYRSAHQVLFVNYEDTFERIVELNAASEGECWFFSGYDCDSLAFEGVSGFVSDTLDFLANDPRASPSGATAPMVELRTKSASIEPLLRRKPLDNVVVAYSLSPASVAQDVEHRAPSLDRRIEALRRLQQHGWRVGLRFDPLLLLPNAHELYSELFAQVFAVLDQATVHSVSLGVFRLPKDFHRRLLRLYPDEPLLAMPFGEREGMVSYREDLEQDLFEGCREQLMTHIAPEQYFPMLS